MAYQLIYNSNYILRLSDNTTIPPDANSGDWIEYQRWLLAGNTPAPAIEPTQEELDRQEETRNAGPTARQWFRDHQAALDFIRLTPAEQAAQIDIIFSDLSPAESAVIKFMAIAVSALIKERYL